MDLDQDGRSDLISGSWPGELYFFRRQADGKFAASEQLMGQDGKSINLGNGASVFAVDWDADGTLDLLVGNMLGDVNWLPGKRVSGRTTFGPPQSITAAGEKLKSPSGEAAPVAADWDGDGNIDLVLGTEDGSVFWYRNVGTAGKPKLEAARTLVGESPVGWKGDENRIRGEWGLRVKPCVVDWDGDGHLDLVTTRSVDPPQPVPGHLTIRRGDGKGGFTDAPGPPLLVPPDPRVEALVDLNGDRRLDIVLSHGRRSILTILLNDGRGEARTHPGRWRRDRWEGRCRLSRN